MKLLVVRRYLNLGKKRRHLWSALGLGSVVITTFILMLMIATVYKQHISTESMWLYSSFFPYESLLWILFFISASCDLLYSMLGSNCTLISLISFGIMFALTSYLLLLSLKFKGFNRPRAARYRTVSSCLWTRRKVY